MTDWIKVMGSYDRPYNQMRHRSRDQRYVWFPGRSSSVQEGDRLLLYSGHPLQRFFAITLVVREPSMTIGSEDGLRLCCRVFTQLAIVDLEDFAVRADNVFPLPSGTKLVSMRQKSHVKIQSDDAIRICTHLQAAAAEETAQMTRAPVQKNLFNR